MLLTPYPDEVTEGGAGMSGRCGIAVTGWAGLGLDDGCDTVTRGQVRKLIPEAGRAAIGKTKAIVLPCTGGQPST